MQARPSRATIIRAILIPVLLFVAALWVPGYRANATPSQAPHILSVTASPTPAPQFGAVTLAVTIHAPDGLNPFDPDQISVWADFSSPTSRKWHVNAFFGTNGWTVRFAPNEPGQWHYVVHAVTPGGDDTAAGRDLMVSPSNNPGFVTVGKKNPEGFVFDNGKPYFAIGENMCWGHRADPVADYESWLPKLHAAGGNYIRIWMAAPGLRVDWTGRANAATFGPNDLNNADKLDKILDIADANNVHVLLTLGTYGELATGGFFNEGQWAKNPYNAANGGPCATPDDFWTKPTAIKLYQQRLRYIMARYGSRTCIMSWELWNEAHPPTAWVKAMGDFIKGTGPYAGHPADPYGHLLTTSYGSDEIWNLPEIDWTQTHFYGDSGNVPDLTPIVIDDAHQFAKYGKPHMMTEFGIDWRKSDIAYDPDGVGAGMHNAIWAAAASGDAGSAMIWWWDNYVDPKNLYAQFTPLAEIANQIDWAAAPWKPLTFDPATANDGPETFGNAVLPTGTGFAKADVTDYTIRRDGTASATVGPTYIFSPGKADLRTIPTFHVDYPEAGQFIIHVADVSGSASLNFTVDGQIVRTLNLNASPPTDAATLPEYKSTKVNKPWKAYLATFDKDYAIDVPAGPHAISLEVTKGDWLSVSAYRLTDYKSSRYPNIRMTGITNGKVALIWVQNTDSTWKAVYDKRPVPTITGANLKVHGISERMLPASLMAYDTQDGHALNAVPDMLVGHIDDGVLGLPDLSGDCAILVQHPVVMRF